jgi:hypothetical protein
VINNGLVNIRNDIRKVLKVDGDVPCIDAHCDKACILIFFQSAYERLQEANRKVIDAEIANVLENMERGAFS